MPNACHSWMDTAVTFAAPCLLSGIEKLCESPKDYQADPSNRTSSRGFMAFLLLVTVCYTYPLIESFDSKLILCKGFTKITDTKWKMMHQNNDKAADTVQFRFLARHLQTR